MPNSTIVMVLHFVNTLPAVTKNDHTECKNSVTLHVFLKQ